MPVYEYQCKKCDHEFEREQRITEKPVKKCPSCGAMQAKRLISRTSFVLKGSGWYGDLYSSSKPGGGDADGAGSEGGSDGGSDGSDDKPAKKKSESKKDGSKTKGKGKKKAAA